MGKNSHTAGERSAYRTYCTNKCGARFLNTKAMRKHQLVDKCSQEHPHAPLHQTWQSLPSARPYLIGNNYGK